MSRQQEILNTPIQDLPFSPELKSLLLEKGHKSLQDLLNVPAYRWHDYPSFTYHHQYEIVDYLQKYDLMDFLKED
ncbi:hypothetical protein OCK74_14815 [Chitinophagaceae bacterium LB-8]|uniref:Uncharacterized protein n=1 Tax=Paraflavisolibacter caeni TaxID=2982496 RepID=A0A9X2XWW5_9BACT|nr:hypothetical protein [Paraflavisolibacter caeni]MCU7550390.1 hypothetical protein [Paraflavisolibacter caeni]